MRQELEMLMNFSLGLTADPSVDGLPRKTMDSFSCLIMALIFSPPALPLSHENDLPHVHLKDAQ